jgi:hypothetical protein
MAILLEHISECKLGAIDPSTLSLEYREGR